MHVEVAITSQQSWHPVAFTTQGTSQPQLILALALQPPQPNPMFRLRASHSMEELLANRKHATPGLAGSGLIQSSPRARCDQTTTRLCTSCDRPVDESSASLVQAEASYSRQGQQNFDIMAASSGQGAVDAEKRRWEANAREATSMPLPYQDFVPNPCRGSALVAEPLAAGPPIPPSFTAYRSLRTRSHHGKVDDTAALNAATVSPSAVSCSSYAGYHRSSLGLVSSGPSPTAATMLLHDDMEQRIGNSCTTTVRRRPRPRQVPTSDGGSEHNDQAGNNHNEVHVEHQNRSSDEKGYSDRRRSSSWVSTTSSQDSEVNKSGWGSDARRRGAAEVGAQRHWWEGDNDFSGSESEGSLEHSCEA